MAWINRIKQILVGFLSTHDNKYIITDTGKKIIGWNYSFGLKTKATTFLPVRVSQVKYYE